MVASLVGCRLPETCDCDASADTAPPADAVVTDAASPDATLDLGADAMARPADMALIDATPRDAAIDRAVDMASVDVGVDAAPVDAGPACVVEACNDADDDCDGIVDEGDACVAAVVAGCLLHLAIQDAGGAESGTNTGGDGRFHGVAPPADLDAGDSITLAWRCEPALAWAEAACAVTLAHADGSAADPTDCAIAACTSTAADAPLVFASDVDGDDRFAIALTCTDPQAPIRAAGVQAGVQAWFATQHRRVGEDGACLDEPLHEDVAEWGFCPGDPVDAEGRHRCAGSAGDGRLHGFPVGTVGAEWPDIGPCDGLGIALTPTR